MKLTLRRSALALVCLAALTLLFGFAIPIGFTIAALIYGVIRMAAKPRAPWMHAGLPLFAFGPNTASKDWRRLDPARFYAVTDDLVGVSSGSIVTFAANDPTRAGHRRSSRLWRWRWRR